MSNCVSEFFGDPSPLAVRHMGLADVLRFIGVDSGYDQRQITDFCSRETLEALE
jgi:hypothetical protein